MSNLRGSAGRFHHSGNFWNHPMPNDQMFGKRSYNMRLSNVQSTNRSHLHRACLAAWPPCSQVTHPCSARDSKRGHLSMASPFHDHAVGITHASMASQVSSQQEQHSISVNQSFQRLDFWQKTTADLKSNEAPCCLFQMVTIFSHPRFASKDWNVVDQGSCEDSTWFNDKLSGSSVLTLSQGNYTSKD